MKIDKYNEQVGDPLMDASRYLVEAKRSLQRAIGLAVMAEADGDREHFKDWAETLEQVGSEIVTIVGAER